MADNDIKQVNPAKVEVDGEEMEINPSAVTSVTTVVPDPADATSYPTEAPKSVNRPPVSTNQANVPIAHSLVAGAGAPTPPTEDDLPLPEDHTPESQPLTAEQKAKAEPVEEAPKAKKSE